ncbi:MAG: flagellar motor protein MotB [Vicinamibacteraceae bacterium]
MSLGGQPIIVKRKKAAHGGHHGGAWKVAYADFVTAMMAFFLVMWLVGQSKPVKASVAAYFRDPGIFDQAKSDGPIAGGDLRLDPEAAPPRETAESNGLVAGERAALEDTAKRIKQRLAESPDLKSLGKQIEIQVTRDGLRIELVDAEQQTFFASGSAALAAGTEKVLELIARELGSLKNSIVIEGHTDSQPYAATDIYSNWELSADRANAARRVMERSGLHVGQVRGVRGYADRQLRVSDEPLDARNRRVSVIVEHLYRTSSLPPGVRELASGGKTAPQESPALVAATAAPEHAPKAEGTSPH